MTRSFVLIICLVLLFALNIQVVQGDDWKSFKGFSSPEPAQIEVVEHIPGKITVDMSLNGMIVQKRNESFGEFDLINLPETRWTTETGKPKLPVVRTFVVIPSDGDVTIKIEDKEHKILQGYRVYPVGRQVVRYKGEMAYIDEEFFMDNGVYSDDNFYPRNSAEISFSGYFREHRLIQLELYPIRYNPKSRDLMCSSYLSVSLNYDSSSTNYNTTPLPELYQSQIANYASLAPSAGGLWNNGAGNINYPEDLLTAQKADYLIIAPNHFYNNEKLRELAEWRSQYTGVDVAVISSSELYYNFGNPTSSPDERIRLFIQYAYDYWVSDNMPDKRIGYVLLIGDVEHLPVHVTDRESFNEIVVTDNWYACVSGDDYMPDVMLGRLPAKNNSELNTMIDKIIKYEQNPIYGNWANNALLMLGTVESLKMDMEHARDEYLLPAGYKVNEIEALNGGNVYNVISQFNSGQHIVDYAGHGWVNGLEVFQQTEMPKLNNSLRLPAIFSLACSTGYFDHPSTDSIAEAMVKGRSGAIAYFGASRLAAISSIGFGLSRAVAGAHIYNLGEATIHAKMSLLPNSINMDLYNLMGDPALDLSAPRRQPGKSDLVISPDDITFKPQEPEQGDDVAIKVKVYNMGAADARNVVVEIRDGELDNKLIDKYDIPRIPAGDYISIETIWSTPLGQPQHNIIVKTYLTDSTQEHYLENNDSQKVIMVSLEDEGWPVKVDERNLSAPIVADIDSDGDMEILIQSTMYQNNKLYVLHHDGQPVSGWPKYAGGFSANGSSQYSNASAGPGPAVGDIDGDGSPEIVAVFFNREINAWNSDGSRLDGWPVRTSGFATSSPVLADIDSDGIHDVIVGLDNGRVEVHKHDGSMLPGWPKYSGRNGHMFSLTIDLDNDGDMEIVALNSPLPKKSTIGSSRMYAWHHDGSPVDGWPVEMKGGDSVLPPVAGDLDGDGTSEVAAVAVFDDTCRVYVWEHDGKLASGWPVVTSQEIRSSLGLVDIDQDGDVEIIATCRNEPVYTWHHDGRRVYGWPIQIEEGYWHSAPIMGDIDGDGQLEVIVTSYGGVIHAYDQNGHKLPGWPAVTEERYTTSPVAIADMDGDSKNEMVYASSSGRIHKLSLTGHYGTQTGIEWNMMGHDQMNTGSYDAKAILPLPPLNVTATDTPDDKGGSITISWKLSPDDYDVSGYVIYRSDSFDGKYSLVGRVFAGTSFYIDESTEVGVTYWYVVRATNGTYLSTSSNTISAYSFNNFAPTKPVHIFAGNGNLDGTIKMSWPMGQEPDLAGYRIYLGTSSGNYTQSINIGKINWHTLKNLENGTKYYMSVSAYDNENNESLKSIEVTATPDDDDKKKPNFSAFYPNKVAEGTGFYIRCGITDESGVYDGPSNADLRGVYLVWDDDGEIQESSRVVEMSPAKGDSFVTDSRIPGQSVNSEFVYKVFAYDNDYDWNNPDDRTQGASKKQTIAITSAPVGIYNYPNPAPAGQYIDKTIFRYYSSTYADVTIRIYDIAGNMVDELESQIQNGGYNETEWNISGVASGIYIYMVEIDPVVGNKEIITKKLAIVK
ncbi:T9SS type A sorting domain-containing protein [Candidatus Poribacteria bacterium]|nr:T9SS type A sorting domain-containing protein [Candidatus Poribacteria bacterium]